MLVLIALAVDVVMITLAAVLNITVNTNTKVGALTVARGQAFYAAEAGIAEAAEHVAVGDTASVMTRWLPDELDYLVTLSAGQDAIGRVVYHATSIGRRGTAVVTVVADLLPADSLVYVYQRREVTPTPPPFPAVVMPWGGH